jgi:hypothetical protein
MIKINLLQRKILLKDIAIAIIIIALPFVFYLYKLVPETKVWETFFFKIESSYYENIQTFFWTSFTKLLTLFIMFIWFLTCKHWWRYAVLVPIIIEINKLLVILNDELHYIDEYEYIYSLPLTIPILLFLLFLSKKLNYYNWSKSLNNELNDEIDSLLEEMSNFKINDYKVVKKELKALRHGKNNLDKKDYLKKLIVLRDKLVEL